MRSIDTASTAQRGSAPVPSQGFKAKASRAMGSPSKSQTVSTRESSMRADKKQGARAMGVGPKAKPKASAASRSTLRKASAAAGGPSKKQVTGYKEAAMRFDKKMTYGRYPGRKG